MQKKLLNEFAFNTNEKLKNVNIFSCTSTFLNYALCNFYCFLLFCVVVSTKLFKLMRILPRIPFCVAI